VEAGSPAEKGGIQAGDIIVEVNGTVIANVDQLLEMVGKLTVNDTLQVTVYRAEGMLEALTAYFNRENVYLSDFPTDGEYVEVSVGLAMLDEAAS
jgi:S1-C subfamily serine protease